MQYTFQDGNHTQQFLNRRLYVQKKKNEVFTVQYF